MFLILCTHIVFAQAWDTNGNIVVAGKNKIGSLNDESVVFITNDIERMRLTNTGYFGINTTSPTKCLDVNEQIRLRYNAIIYGVLTSDASGNATWSLLDLNLSSNTLSIQNQGNTVDLTPYLDNTDSQTLDLTGTTLSISNGNNALFTGWDTDASNDFSGDYNDLTNLPTLFDGNYNSLSDLPTLFDGNWSSLQGTVPTISSFNNDAGYIINADDADADPANEIQTVSLSGQNLTLSNGGGTITLPDAVNNADADPTNEIQNLSISENMLGISGGSGVSLDGINYWSKLNDNLHYNNGNVGIGTDVPRKLLHIHSDVTYSPGGGFSTGHNPIKKSGSFNNTMSVSSTSSMLLTNLNSGNTATDGLIIRSYNNNATIYLQEEGSLSLITKNDLRFKMQQNGNVSIGKINTNYFTVNDNENVGIGTENPQNALDVAGTIRSKEWIVEQTGWNDFVFDDNYNLPSLKEREEQILLNKHLPYILPEKQILEDGAPMGSTITGLLQNTEELYLYLFQLNEKIQSLENENKDFKQLIENMNQ